MNLYVHIYSINAFLQRIWQKKALLCLANRDIKR